MNDQKTNAQHIIIKMKVVLRYIQQVQTTKAQLLILSVNTITLLSLVPTSHMGMAIHMQGQYGIYL